MGSITASDIHNWKFSVIHCVDACKSHCTWKWLTCKCTSWNKYTHILLIWVEEHHAFDMNADWAASQSQYCSMIQKMACPNWGLLWRDAGWWLIATSKLSVVKIPGKHCDRWNVVAWKPKNLRSKEKMPLTDERMWLSWRCALKFGLDGSLVEAEHHPFREHPDYVSIHHEQINTSQIRQEVIWINNTVILQEFDMFGYWGGIPNEFALRHFESLLPWP